MVNSKLKQILTALTVTAALAAVPVYASASGDISAEEMSKRVEEGKKVAYDRGKGNCLACHMMDDGVSPGTTGPALIAMKIRFQDKTDLYNRLWGPAKYGDKVKHDPYSMMPYFGQHGILTDEEISKVVDYLMTL